MKWKELSLQPVSTEPPPYHQPSPGDVVQYYYGQVDKWLEVIIPSTTKRSLKRFPNYYNVRYGEGDEGNAEMSRGTLWCHSDPESNSSPGGGGTTCTGRGLSRGRRKKFM